MCVCVWQKTKECKLITAAIFFQHQLSEPAEFKSCENKYSMHQYLRDTDVFSI